MRIDLSFRQKMVLSALLMAWMNAADAGISIDRTRLIVNGDAPSASANLPNTSTDIPFLAQSWLEDKTGKKITSPLLVLPALQRINGGQKGVIRLTKTNEINLLPQDRETIFYLNVREIPPKPKRANVLQLSMQSRIKVFYRPVQIIPKDRNEIWQNRVVFRKSGEKFIAENPTPYFITLIGLTRGLEKDGGTRLTEFPGIMISPKSSLDFPVKDRGVTDFVMMYVNDYGGHPEIKYHCESDICRALPEDRQPK